MRTKKVISMLTVILMLLSILMTAGLAAGESASAEQEAAAEALPVEEAEADPAAAEPDDGAAAAFAGSDMQEEVSEPSGTRDGASPEAAEDVSESVVSEDAADAEELPAAEGDAEIDPSVYAVFSTNGPYMDTDTAVRDAKDEQTWHYISGETAIDLYYFSLGNFIGGLSNEYEIGQTVGELVDVRLLGGYDGESIHMEIRPYDEDTWYDDQPIYEYRVYSHVYNTEEDIYRIACEWSGGTDYYYFEAPGKSTGINGTLTGYNGEPPVETVGDEAVKYTFPENQERNVDPSLYDGENGTGVRVVFAGDVTVNTGSVTLYNLSNGQKVRTIDITDGERVTVIGDILQLRFGLLPPASELCVVFEKGCLNVDGKRFVGLSDQAGWRFTTAEDRDNDGLPDIWEMNGADVDGDGVVDVDLPAMGADPNVPDIFVEVDWMKDRRLDTGVLKPVVEQFAAHGIRLHIDMGSDSTDFVTENPWGELSGGNEIPYSEVFELGESNGLWTAAVMPIFDQSRWTIFRHCLVVNAIRVDALHGGYSGYSQGIPGQYFLLANTDNAMVELTKKDIDKQVSEAEVARRAPGTFMHELGHTLGLYHGGDEDVNYKPNYLSVMNYLFQFGLLGTSKEFNYSEYVLPALDESNLDETRGVDPDGVTAGTGLTIRWIYNGVSPSEFMDARIEGLSAGAIAGNPIDFNMNGIYETGLKADLNDDNPWILSVLSASVNDWERLVFKGGGIGGAGIEYDEFTIPVSSEPEALEELTYELAEELGLLSNEVSPASRRRGDINGDGVVNRQDRVWLARGLAGWEDYPLPGADTADVNSDGNVNRQDRVWLARALAGWEGYALDGK